MKTIHWMGIFFVIIILPVCALGNDWPMWRYDANRSANSPQELSDSLQLLWTRSYPAQVSVWDDPLNQDLMQYDKVYEPVVMGDALFVGSNATDSMTAIHTETGEEKWSFFANGPVRFPAVAVDGCVYFVSDDGFLYCLNAANGELKWKFSGIPNERMVLGNERLISTWPARGAPVYQDGVVYFASGIWPFMGIFVYAVDAQTGEEIWVNDSTSSTFMKQPHNSESFASIAPQGSLAIAGDKLLVPGGRSVPACFDLKTGDYVYYRLAESGKTGGAFVAANEKHFINYHRDYVTSLYDMESGNRILGEIGKIPVLTDAALYCMGESVKALDYANMGEKEVERIIRDRNTGEMKVATRSVFGIDTLWELDVDASGDLIKVGNKLYAGGKNVVSAISLPSTTNDKAQALWSHPIDGTAARVLAADDKLFVVTLEGTIHAFSANAASAKSHPWKPKTSALDEPVIERAKQIVQSTQIKDGYALALGVGNGDILQALHDHSDLRLTVLEPNAEKASQLRRRFADAGILGKRLAIFQGDATSIALPPYFASLILVDDPKEIPGGMSKRFFNDYYESLRPYGGTLAIWKGDLDGMEAIKTFQDCGLQQGKAYNEGDMLLFKREGALPGTDNWTHQYGDIANTVKSDDQMVKLPLGLLWFGGSSNMDVLPRHGHGPPQQIVDGRLFIEGMSSLNARDVYTGRVLWKRDFGDLGNHNVYYDDTYEDTPLDTKYNQIHIPGSNARGTNYVVTEDKIYLVKDNHCMVLDPATGDDLGTIQLPTFIDSSPDEEWGYIGVYHDYLIAGAGFVSYMDFLQLDDSLEDKKKPFVNFDITSSKRLVVMDRHSGDVKWTFNADLGLRHNAIVAGDGKLFCIDRMPDPVWEALQRRGVRVSGTPRLLAFDIATGKIVWNETEDIFGTWLSYAEKEDLVLEAGRHSRDMLIGEPQESIHAYRGANGDVVWKNDAAYGGPLIIHGEKIITDRFAFHLLSGEQLMRENPMTGEKTPWEFQRNYGCNYAVASEYMMTFRSAAAGFFDLDNDGGTGNFGGFKSGCTSNLIAANGVLNAPDYTRTCSCSYQNQTSLALIHDPAVESWTFNDLDMGQGPIHRLGVNFGAPGDRRSEEGTLWLDYPIVGGPSPELNIAIEPAGWERFLHHSSRMAGDAEHWISASGIIGAQSISIPLNNPGSANALYTVRLFFAEPKPIQPGERVFDVLLQGKTVVEGLDVIEKGRKIRSGFVMEFSGIPANEALTIGLAPKEGGLPPVISGIEAVEESKKQIGQK